MSRLSGFIRAASVAAIIALGAACSSGGGGSSGEKSITLEGTVVDGYVRGATVTLYGADGFGGPTAIATGTTDDNGDFVLTLPESELPDTIGLLSRGGTVIDTGLPAPTMAMLALRDRERYYVTPLTDRVVWQGLRPGSSFFEAEQKLAASLELLPAELYDDPLADGAPQALVDGLYRALATGDHATLLADGTYRLSLFHLDRYHLNDPFVAEEHLLDGTVTVADGAISGTVGGEAVSGRVQGANLVLSIVYPDDEGVTRVAGTVGLLGSLSGTYVDLYIDESGPKLSSGVFVGSLIPDEGVDAAGFANLAKRIYDGERNALFRDLYGDRDLGWGTLGAVTIDTEAGTVSTDNFTIRLNAAAGATDTLTFTEGTLLSFDDGTLNGLAVMHFVDSGGDYAYLIQALGNRRGIYLAGGDSEGIYAIGEAYLAHREALGSDVLTRLAGDEMTLTVSGISPHLLGATRDPQVVDNFVDTITLAVPEVTDGVGAHGDAAAEGGVLVVSGSLLGVKYSAQGASTTEIDHMDDFLAVAELYATGALQGDIVEGGSVMGLDAADWPVPLVGFVTATNASTALLDLGEVQLDFLARPLYTLDLSGGEPSVASLEDYSLIITGTIHVRDDAAILAYRDSEGEAGTLLLTMENRGGIYHLRGPMGDEYLDLLWPAGGKRAVFLSSTAADGFGQIYEIGEAFITY